MEVLMHGIFWSVKIFQTAFPFGTTPSPCVIVTSVVEGTQSIFELPSYFMIIFYMCLTSEHSVNEGIRQGYQAQNSDHSQMC